MSERGYDFGQIIYHETVGDGFLLNFLEKDDFRLRAERVKPNQYIQNGADIIDRRGIMFSLEISLTHLPTGSRQDFKRDDLEDQFTVIKQPKI